MIGLSCHCKNVQIEVSKKPETVTSCNCSVCNRYGTLWGYYTPEDVKVEFTKKPTQTYARGDKYLDFHHCPICGCVTHYTCRDKEPQKRTAVNFRMADLELMESLRVRKFDGAHTWKYIED